MDQQVAFVRLCTCILAIETHIKFNGRMMLTRTATPATLRAIATEYTGRHYPRSRRGLELALADLKKVKHNALDHAAQTA